MINKSLDEFIKDKANYEQNITNAKTKEEQISIRNNFKNSLKLYLFEANKLIKSIFNIKPTPYIEENGINALFQKDVNATNIINKSKKDYYHELDILKASSIYQNLDQNKKALIDNAIYILKFYYSDSLK
jgi:hypothetical protein